VDLPGDTRPLLGDRAPELGEADRPPDAGEKQAVRDEAQEVSLGDDAARHDRREDVVQLRGEHQRGRKGQPAVEVLAVAPVAEAEAADGHEAEEALEREGDDHQNRLTGAELEARQRVAGGPGENPDRAERGPDDHEGQAKRPAALREPPSGEGGGRDQRQSRDAPGDAGPRFRGLDRLAAEHRTDSEEEPPSGRGRESRAQEQVEAPALDGEADAGEDGDDRRGQHHPGVERQPEVRKLVRRAKIGVGEKQRQGGAEQADEQQLADEPRLVGVTVVAPHFPLVGKEVAADKGPGCSRAC
jgi:hypothetical protein